MARLGRGLRIIAVGRNPRKTVLRAAILAVVCIVTFKWILLPTRVVGISMEPTYADRSVNFINRVPYFLHEPKRGDVVGVRLTPPSGIEAPHIMFFKRILALPGETISFVGGHPQVNGKPLKEPYETGLCNWNVPEVKLGAGEYFVVGDNRDMPKEYHSFGKTERNRIVGKALW